MFLKVRFENVPPIEGVQRGYQYFSLAPSRSKKSSERSV